MKLRPASLHFALPFHGPLRFGRRWRGHELLLRILQLVLLIALALPAAKLIAHGVALAVRTIAGFLS